MHLSPCKDGGPEQIVDAGNRLDHVAFFGHDLEKTLAGLDELGVAYEKHPNRLYLDSEMVQVFLKDPNGINGELGFFPHRDEMFRASMEEYQAAARQGDKKLNTMTNVKTKKSAHEKVSA